jgi:hypothetical protein
VIRSYNSSIELDVTPTAETDERHIAPPRIAVRLAEAHGVLDDAQGRLKGDAATYTMIATRDAYDLPNQGGIAIGGRLVHPFGLHQVEQRRCMGRRKPYATMRNGQAEVFHVKKTVNGMTSHVEENCVRHRRILPFLRQVVGVRAVSLENAVWSVVAGAPG